MNTENETIVNSEMMKRLKEANLAGGYVPVPKELEEKARRLLDGGDIASFTPEIKRRLRNFKKRMRRAGKPGW